ncbi:MAG: LytTR family DNA-binding domain-containing protein [Bryobacteraceae bacterium]|nr:LytTR family DNA-binding domain-containing protein [Bryobacteraceae bacterium]
MLRAYLVDDEPLALRRLLRLLAGRIEIAGSTSDPLAAIAEIERTEPDVLFLDIEMPELNGFQLLARLSAHPLVVFTTAYDEYALRAFEVTSVDYLLKPIEEAALQRALAKVERLLGGAEPRPDLRRLLDRIAQQVPSTYPTRIASRIGDRTIFVDVGQVTHFLAEDKLTYAVTPQKRYCVDYTITELEARLDPRHFVRVHRSTLANLEWIQELSSWFGGRVVLNLKDPAGTRITVSRDRVRELKEKLGLAR